MNKNRYDYEKFINKNKDFNIMEEMLNEASLEKCNLEGIDINAVLSYGDTLQTMHNIHESIDVKHALIDNGFTSSTEICRYSKDDFIDSIKDTVCKESAEKVYQKAKQNQILVSNLLMALKTTYGSEYYKSLNFGEDHLDIEKDLKSIPNYQEIFGSLNYCQCEECKSIFGPAAYFVDLLRIITSSKYIVYATEDKAIKLQERRADLIDELTLTCENTNRLVPYLKIVNSILEKYIKKTTAWNDEFQSLSKARYPWRFPFVLPFEQLKIILEKGAGVRLTQLYKTFHMEDSQSVRAYMGVTTELFQELTNPIKAEDLHQYFGVEKLNMEDISIVSNFQRIAGWSIGEVYNLLFHGIEETETKILHSLFINQGLEEHKYLLVDVEDLKESSAKKVVIKNLNADALERIYRYNKVKDCLGVTFEEIDWILKIVNQGRADINKDILSCAVSLLEFARKHTFDILQVTSLIGPLKPYGKRKQVILEEDIYEQNKNDDSSMFRLLAIRFKKPIDDLKLLAKEVFKKATVPTQWEEIEALYRYCLLADLFGLPIKELIEYLRNMNLLGQRIFQLKELEDLASIRDRCRINIFDISYVSKALESQWVNLPFTLKQLSTFIYDIRKRLPAENNEQNKEFIKTLLLEEIAAYIDTDTNTLFDLVRCVAKKEEETQWIINLITNTPEEILEKVKILSKWYILYRNSIDLPLLIKASKLPSAFEKNEVIMNMDGLLAISVLQTLIVQCNDTQYQLLQFLEHPDDFDLLATVTGWEKEQIKLVVQYIPKEKGSIVFYLENIYNCFQLIQKLNLDMNIVKKIVSLDCMSASNYTTNQTIVEKFLAIENTEDIDLAIAARKRDALLSYARFLLGKEYASIESYDDVYKYFLIDVQMDEMTKISFIKEGINALQLYLQRCRTGLEEGVKKLNIPDSWWSWLLNYRMWEANRKIFVYPENYLLPGLRQTKTALFQNMEDALNQNAATDAVVEDQYIQYLADYEDLTRLKICSAYATCIDCVDVLYLFAKTQMKPYTYYYCKRTGGLAWSEWFKIDVTVEAEQIAPVFVFNRLHIFWTNIKKMDRGSAQNKTEDEKVLLINNKISRTIEVKYTYLNLQNKWVLPQTLVEDEIIYYHNSKDTSKSNDETGYMEKLFSEDNDCWKKPVLLRLTDHNIDEYMGVASDYERLAVLVGPCIANFNQEIKPYPLKPEDDTDKKNYLKKLNRIIEFNNFLYHNSGNGHFCMGISKLYNIDMEETTFLYETEFMLLDNYLPSDHGFLYKIVKDSVHKIAGVVYSKSALKDSLRDHNEILSYINRETINRETLHNSKVKLKATDFPSAKIFDCLKNVGIINQEDFFEEEALIGKNLTEILKNAIGVESNTFAEDLNKTHERLLKSAGALYLFSYNDSAEIIPVDNQPGWFIFDCKDEAFLTYPYYIDENENETPIQFTKLDQGIRIGNEPITYVTLTRRGFITGYAKKIIFLLQENNLLSEHNIANRLACTKKNVFAALTDESLSLTVAQKNRIYGLLQNFPYVTENLFDDLGLAESQDIFDKLVEKEIIFSVSNEETLPDYRLDLITYKMNNDIVLHYSEDITKKVFDRLSSIVTSVTLNYINEQDWDVNLSDKKFAVQRLTNCSIKKMKSRLIHGGVKHFLSLETQSEPDKPVLPFDRLYPNEKNVKPPRAKDGVQIDFEGLYAEYNWELFYHIPMSIAENFHHNFSNDAAMKWFHFTFNPTKEKPEKGGKYYWNFMPFVYTQEQKLKSILTDTTAIATYNNHPFNPHAIARLRIGAYEKYTVMEYISNIIQWGDRYFTQNTWESLTSATMMYVLASDLLGPRPVEIGKRTPDIPLTFKMIKEVYDEVPQFIIELEKFLQRNSRLQNIMITNPEIPFNDIGSYFCIPENDQLISYWDMVEDRLFKIRNSLDINGAPRTIKLFEPALDIAGLMKALPSSGGNSEYLTRESKLYPYRFQYVIEQTKNLTNTLIQLSNAMLSAIEKKDAEALVKIVTGQEKTILEMMTEIKENQIREIEENIGALNKLKENSKNRQEYFEKQANEYLSDKERTSLDAATAAFALATAASVIKTASGIAHLIPQIGSPFAMTYGGNQIGQSLSAVSDVIEIGASISSFISQRSMTMAGYDRRRDEWKLQGAQSHKEMENFDKQIEATKIRKAVAEKELIIHKKSIQHKNEVYDYVFNKFTNSQLYQWLIGKISTTMWQTYQLALDLSLAAQEAYQYERDVNNTFIRFDYWDSGKKGLFAGEGLLLSLHQMQDAYIKGNTRRLEIEKNISLAFTCPEAFLQLKAEGNCSFSLPELIFASDYPGCYCRKISCVSISIPAVLPPYQTLKAVLKQKESKVLLQPDTKGMDYLLGDEKKQPDEGVLRIIGGRNEKIAISRGIEDNGMFQLNFNDERYLPFEGTGANSQWNLEMPKESNRFDFDSISDIILNIKYTALEDETLKKHVRDKLKHKPSVGGLYYRLKEMFYAQWSLFSESDGQKHTLQFTIEAFPLTYYKEVKITSLLFKMNTVMPIENEKGLLSIKFPNKEQLIPVDINKDIGFIKDMKMNLADLIGQWEISVNLSKEASFKNIKDIEMLLLYEGRWHLYDNEG